MKGQDPFGEMTPEEILRHFPGTKLIIEISKQAQRKFKENPVM